jgi:Protein of unknown function (DUF1571)
VKFKVVCFFVLVLFLVFSFKETYNPRPAKILHQLFDSIKNVKTLRVKVTSLERIEKKFLSASSEMKIQTLPRKLYFVNKFKKLEILFDSEHSANKALVKLHSFPYLSLSLDPMGNLMRKNQHYTINELGYEFIGKSIALTISKDKDGVNNFTNKGKVIKNGYSCYLLEYENLAYSYIDYTVGVYETVSIIANKQCVNDYLVRYRNNLLNDFGFLKKGTVIKIPNLYCKKALLYIDEKLMLPVSLNLSDDIGVFESYDFTGIEVNKPFKENEFKKDNKEYGF